MKLSIRNGSMRWLCITAAATRVFFGAAIDLPELYSASWLAALLGGALFLPFALAADRYARRSDQPVLQRLEQDLGKIAARGLYLIWCIYLMFDAACIAQAINYSAEYTALRQNSIGLQLIFLMGTAWYTASTNGTGIGGSARIWAHIFPWFAAIVFVLQFPSYRLGYLMPLFGKSVPTLLDGALRCAGWYGLLLPAWIIAQPGKDGKPLRLTACLGIAAGIACLTLIMFRMETPPVQSTSHTRVFQMNAVMTNGRFPLSLQVPIIIIWFGSLLHLLTFEIFTPALLIQRCTAERRGRKLTMLCTIVSSALALIGLAEQESVLWLSQWTYPGLWCTAALALLAAAFRKAGKRHCENMA